LPLCPGVEPTFATMSTTTATRRTPPTSTVRRRRSRVRLRRSETFWPEVRGVLTDAA
jgi:hypothetical protein